MHLDGEHADTDGGDRGDTGADDESMIFLYSHIHFIILRY